jgi:hypothetical protein
MLHVHHVGAGAQARYFLEPEARLEAARAALPAGAAEELVVGQDDELELGQAEAFGQDAELEAGTPLSSSSSSRRAFCPGLSQKSVTFSPAS